jgi:hypothetical protein
MARRHERVDGMRSRCLRLCLPGLLVLGVLLAAAGPASARTYASSCGNDRYKPRQVVIACGDGNFGLKHMHWPKWTAGRAFGRGLAYANDCDPFCAGGHFHSYRVRVVLHGALSCDGVRIYRYARIRFVRHRPAGVPRVYRTSFSCL